MRSFRVRLLWGCVLGSIGLLMIAHLTSFLLVRQFGMVIRFGHGAPFAVIAMVLVVLGLLQLGKGLSPFDRLRARLAAVREGKDHRIEGSYPTEVQPLVNDLNSLLDHREMIVKRALAKAGDLAHGLKTPLAVLSQEAERVKAAGHPELATNISQQVDRMRRQVDYHLAQARAAASGATPGARCDLSASVEGLTRTLLRLYTDRGIAIEQVVSPEHFVQAEREDVEEMLGNILDNACKWAKSRVAIASSENVDAIVITVDDDGPGVPPSMRPLVLQRGVRADEAAPGSGLGLAIALDLAELYGGSITLDDSPLGGLRVRVNLRHPRRPPNPN
jgi:signal transduction histidine kinase